MTLNEYISSHRESGLTKSGFAAQVGVSPSIITRILNGERKPNIVTAWRIIEATGGEVQLIDLVNA